MNSLTLNTKLLPRITLTVDGKYVPGASITSASHQCGVDVNELRERLKRSNPLSVEFQGRTFKITGLEDHLVEDPARSVSPLSEVRANYRAVRTPGAVGGRSTNDTGRTDVDQTTLHGPGPSSEE